MVWDKMRSCFWESPNIRTDSRSCRFSPTRSGEMWQFWGKKPQSTTAEGVFLLLSFCLEAKYSKIPFVAEGNFMWKAHTVIGFSTGEQWFFSLGKKFLRCEKKNHAKSSGVLTWCNQQKWAPRPRVYLGFGLGSMSYIYLARVYRQGLSGQ